MRTVRDFHDKGVIHRDLKCENILFSDKEKTEIKIIDFGVATLMKQEVSRAGSLPFMAPEMLEGEALPSPAVDVWSIGCILFELLSGQKTFWGTREQIKRKILAVDVAYPDYFSEEVMEVLKGIFEEDPVLRLNIKQILHSNWMKGSVANFTRRKKMTVKELRSDKTIVFRATNNKKLENLREEFKKRAVKRTKTLKPISNADFMHTLRTDHSNINSEETSTSRVYNSARTILRKSTIQASKFDSPGATYLRLNGKNNTQKRSKKFIHVLSPRNKGKLGLNKTTSKPGSSTELPLISEPSKRQSTFAVQDKRFSKIKLHK